MPNKGLPRLRLWSYSKIKLLPRAHLKSSKISICRRILKKWLGMLSCTLPFDPSDSISCEFSPPLPPNLSLKWYEARAFTAARHLSTTSLSCNRPPKKNYITLKTTNLHFSVNGVKLQIIHTQQRYRFVRDTRSEWVSFIWRGQFNL